MEFVGDGDQSRAEGPRKTFTPREISPTPRSFYKGKVLKNNSTEDFLHFCPPQRKAYLRVYFPKISASPTNPANSRRPQTIAASSSRASAVRALCHVHYVRHERESRRRIARISFAAWQNFRPPRPQFQSSAGRLFHDQACPEREGPSLTHAFGRPAASHIQYCLRYFYLYSSPSERRP